jgi:hypothetical protein
MLAARPARVYGVGDRAPNAGLGATRFQLVAQEPPRSEDRQWFGSQDLLDHVVADVPVEAVLADRCDIEGTERRMLRFRLSDRMPVAAGRHRRGCASEWSQSVRPFAAVFVLTHRFVSGFDGRLSEQPETFSLSNPISLAPP